jgi:hypothetical protein
MSRFPALGSFVVWRVGWLAQGLFSVHSDGAPTASLFQHAHFTFISITVAGHREFSRLLSITGDFTQNDVVSVMAIYHQLTAQGHEIHVEAMSARTHVPPVFRM